MTRNVCVKSSMELFKNMSYKNCNTEVNSLSEYLHIIKNLSGINYFRGQNSHFYDLVPSLYRDVEGFKSSLAIFEEFMIFTAKNRFPELFKKVQTPLQELCIMQHYGLPTRLLDISENPLISLYFACQGNDSSKKDNGIVFVFEDNEYRYTSIRNYAIQNLIAESYLLYGLKLHEIYDFMIIQDYSKKEIHNNKSQEDKVNYIIKNFKPQIVEAPYFLLRQNVQKAKYILVCDKILDNNNNIVFSLQRNIKEELKELNNMPSKLITIPAKCKENILKELNLIGINQSFVFPEKEEFYTKAFSEIKKEAKERLKISLNN